MLLTYIGHYVTAEIRSNTTCVIRCITFHPNHTRDERSVELKGLSIRIISCAVEQTVNVYLKAASLNIQDMMAEMMDRSRTPSQVSRQVSISQQTFKFIQLKLQKLFRVSRAACRV